MSEVIPLGLLAFLAGLVDAIVGGGGLIQLPALSIFLPAGTLPADALGTNKFSSVAGTSAAAATYARRIPIDWRLLAPAMGAAFVCSFIGARLATLVAQDVLRLVIIVLLVVVAVYTFFKKDLSPRSENLPGQRRARLYALAIGGSLGFYDGFFGPGTGAFLIFSFVKILGLDFLRASALAKMINLTTNLAALLYFASTSHVLYYIGLPMALCNVAGGLLGSRLAIARGSDFVRKVFMLVVCALIVKLVYDVATF